jgi:hypothetical protein
MGRREIYIREILPRMRTTRFFPCSGGGYSLDCTLQDVAQFECFDEVTTPQIVASVYQPYISRSKRIRRGRRKEGKGEGKDIRIPNHTSILDTNFVVVGVYGTHLFDPLVEGFLRSFTVTLSDLDGE